MTVLFKSDPTRAAIWARNFAEHAPDIEFRVWPECGDLAEIEYLVAWAPSRDLLASLTSLKVLFCTGAGVDQLGFDAVPQHIPIVRMIEPGIIEGMVEYVCWAVLSIHRTMLDYAEQQRQAVWHELPLVLAATRTVGVMGLGVLGKAVLERLAAFGYRLRGWSRSPTSMAGVECFAGDAELGRFLGGCHILVCLLPLTDATRGILDRALFAQLPRGAALVNVARGGHLRSDDLIAALDSGQLSQAILDVTDPEPLPPSHPLWRHPRVVVTPHIASITQPLTAARELLANLRRLQRNEPLVGLIDRARGY